MSLETELKLRVESHGPVRQRLKDVGARFIEAVVETNRIYDRADGMLRKRGCGLRLRTALPLDGTTSRATLTFKGPRLATALKSREEIEVGITDAISLAQVLEELGFVPILCYQKRRESWQLNGCRVELDEPARLGLFVEIEGPDEGSIRAVQTALELDKACEVPTSYVGMLMAYCEAYGIADRTLNLPAGGATEE
jgi:predicted adenylyl cyclase CyaB